MIVKMSVKYFAIFCIILSIKADEIVQTTYGQVRGLRVRSGFFASYMAFRGIPFAEPPVGNLRFRAPLPPKEWTGVRDATKYSSRCLSTGVFGILTGGDEDCLYLNVYTNDVNGNYPVMVWLYGGAFVLGDGGPFLYGPEYLLKENMIVVTLNYRLAAFGFLSTGDKHAQGNYAIKDALLALQWVKANIKNFGGDDSRITLAGESAGAVITHHLSMSHKTEGLFQRAIMMSGHALMSFSFQPNPLAKAETLASNMGIKFNSTQDLVEKLRAASADDILKNTRDILNQDYPFGNRPFDFVISVESEDSIDERFVTQSPEESMAGGKYRRVPMILGTTSKEGLLAIIKTHMDPSFLEDYNRNPDYLVPYSFHLNDTDRAIEVANAARNVYFNGERLTDSLKDEFAIFQTDTNFLFPTDRVLRIIANNSDTPIYNYRFSFDGAHNMVKLFLFVKGYSGACHADDLFYLFRAGFPILSWPWDHSWTVQKRMLSLWGNFVKTGNPTPDNAVNDLIDVSWPKYTLTEEFYLDIGFDLTVQAHHENLKMWRDFQQKFTNHP